MSVRSTGKGRFAGREHLVDLGDQAGGVVDVGARRQVELGGHRVRHPLERAAKLKSRIAPFSMSSVAVRPSMYSMKYGRWLANELL